LLFLGLNSSKKGSTEGTKGHKPCADFSQKELVAIDVTRETPALNEEKVSYSDCTGHVNDFLAWGRVDTP